MSDIPNDDGNLAKVYESTSKSSLFAPGSGAYIERARRVIPRGVASAARARERSTPLVISMAHGSKVVDIDGTTYVDFVMSMGPSLLGHRPPAVLRAAISQLERGILFGGQHAGELELAERIVALVPSAESVTFSSTGSEAVHAALRIARAATARNLVVKFEGHYHGWIDPVNVSNFGCVPGDGPPPYTPVPTSLALDPPQNVLVCPWNDLGALRTLLKEYGAAVAAVIMEPAACNSGNYESAPGYLPAVREMCDDFGALLIFDEVITGFRLALGGAQERYKVLPDLTVLAKAIASGFPLSAIAGREEIMRCIATGALPHMGTNNAHPVSVAAANATLQELSAREQELYPTLEKRSRELAEGLREIAMRSNVPLAVQQVGAVLQLLWNVRTPVESYRDAAAGDPAPIAALSAALLERNVHSLERGLWFVSAAHTDGDIQSTLQAAERAIRDVAAVYS